MWINEKTFSIGDLENSEEYIEFINAEYEGDYAERLLHVNEMIKRLSAERDILNGEK